MMQVTAASLLALIGVFDVIGTLFSGWLTDKFDPRKLLFFYYFITWTFIIFVAIYSL